jgi:hypothetical protein
MAYKSTNLLLSAHIDAACHFGKDPEYRVKEDNSINTAIQKNISFR